MNTNYNRPCNFMKRTALRGDLSSIEVGPSTRSPLTPLVLDACQPAGYNLQREPCSNFNTNKVKLISTHPGHHSSSTSARAAPLPGCPRLL
eukprot:XP_001692338.1 predicted protein [Chlamydomonas reinhardtii]